MNKRVKAFIIVSILIVTTICTSIPVFGAQKTKVDPTLAVSPVFAQSQYALLNPGVAAQCNYDASLMYNHFMADGVRNGERMYATLAPTSVEKLFLFMSYNRKDYVKNGLKPSFPYFDLNNYIAQNPGLIAVYGTNADMYLYHYVNFGVYEGKSSGSLTDPAKVVAWNSGIAGLDNPRLDPKKIMNNYTAVTGQISTAILNAPVPQTAPKETVTYYASPSKHEHDWKYESIDDEKHWKECRDCDERYKEDHNYHVYSTAYGSDTTKHTLMCKKCDHKMAEAHSRKYTYNGGTSGTHKITCKVCGYVINAAEECDMNGTGSSCSKCGHLNGVIPEHTHEFLYESDGDGTHTGHCTYAGCDVTDPGDCDHDGEGGTCSVCGYVWPEQTHTHTYGDVWSSNNNGKHSRSCTATDCPDREGSTVTEDCNHGGGETGGTCSVCGYNWSTTTSGD